VEYERDGYLDLDSVIAAVELDDYTEVYTTHQVFLLNLPLTDFMTKWMQ